MCKYTKKTRIAETVRVDFWKLLLLSDSLRNTASRRPDVNQPCLVFVSSNNACTSPNQLPSKYRQWSRRVKKFVTRYRGCKKNRKKYSNYSVQSLTAYVRCEDFLICFSFRCYTFYLWSLRGVQFFRYQPNPCQTVLALTVNTYVFDCNGWEIFSGMVCSSWWYQKMFEISCILALKTVHSWLT